MLDVFGRSGVLLVPALGVLALAFLVIGVPVLLLLRWRRKAQQLGYPRLRAYLRSVPRDDEEKADAIEMTLKGLVLCILAVVFPPLLIGLFPFYYGARKLSFAWLGLELLENRDESGGSTAR